MITVDTSQLEKALKAIDFKGADLLNIEGSGAAVLSNGMKMRVRKDTAATANSVQSHIVEKTDNRVIDEVGPETTYAPWLEYGTGEKAEKGDGRKGGWSYKDTDGNWHFTRGMKAQPFVRPTAQQDFDKVIRAIGTTFGQLLVQRWPK
jgi:HK97 gp10 family phage protein